MWIYSPIAEPEAATGNAATRLIEATAEAPVSTGCDANVVGRHVPLAFYLVGHYGFLLANSLHTRLVL
jgi:hypothetical protein